MITLVINGYSGVGKSSLVSTFGAKVEVAEWSIADWARSIVLPAIKDSDRRAKKAVYSDEYRSTLMNLTNIGKEKGYVWEGLIEAYNDALLSRKDVFFIHCRDTDDFSKIESYIDDVLTVLVKRDGIGPSSEQDKQVVNYDYDVTIDLTDGITFDDTAYFLELVRFLLVMSTYYDLVKEKEERERQ